LSEEKVDILTMLRDHPFMRDLPEKYVQQIAEFSSLVRFKSGQKVFSEGEVHMKFYLIVYSLVALYSEVPSKGELRFETVRGGEVLGWSSLVKPFTKTASARVVEPTLAIAIDSNKLLEMMERDHELGYYIFNKLVQIVASRLKAVRFQLLDIYASLKRGKSESD